MCVSRAFQSELPIAPLILTYETLLRALPESACWLDALRPGAATIVTSHVSFILQIHTLNLPHQLLCIGFGMDNLRETVESGLILGMSSLEGRGNRTNILGNRSALGCTLRR